ncbi:MAG: hypothetical protein LBG73_03175 [Spirochaetaceae bacterium]|jgi:hypothetical protein|nr:hypothetical protein [Spirochaetaceae bacterium]
MSQPESGAFWNTGSASGAVVFYGTAGIYSRREDSLRLALEDAAKKAAIFNGLEARITSVLNTGGGIFDYRSETETFLQYDEDYKKYVDGLIFDPETDVLQKDGAIFVRVRYKTPVQIPAGWASFQRPEKPSWITVPPEIPGYITGIGYAGRRSAHRDTVTASYENAIFAIITALYGSAQEETRHIRGSGTFDWRSSSSQEITAAGRLQRFYALDAWVNPADKSVWTLGIAQKPAE